MIESLLNKREIKNYLQLFPEKYWKSVIVNTLDIGIKALKEKHELPTLTAEDLKIISQNYEKEKSKERVNYFKSRNQIRSKPSSEWRTGCSSSKSKPKQNQSNSCNNANNITPLFDYSKNNNKIDNNDCVLYPSDSACEINSRTNPGNYNNYNNDDNNDNNDNFNNYNPYIVEPLSNKNNSRHNNNNNLNDQNDMHNYKNNRYNTNINTHHNDFINNNKNNNRTTSNIRNISDISNTNKPKNVKPNNTYNNYNSTNNFSYVNNEAKLRNKTPDNNERNQRNKRFTDSLGMINAIYPDWWGTGNNEDDISVQEEPISLTQVNKKAFNQQLSLKERKAIIERSRRDNTPSGSGGYRGKSQPIINTRDRIYDRPTKVEVSYYSHY